MEFGISDQACDIVVLQQRVGEDLGRGEAGVCSVECCNQGAVDQRQLCD